MNIEYRILNRECRRVGASKLRSSVFFILCSTVWLTAFHAAAQMPHQVAVLVNEKSQASKKAANVFAELHGVPDCNLIYLDLPESMFSGRFECTSDEFRTLIYDPAQKSIEARGLNNQIRAWVYSVDFPIRVVTSPNDRQQMSLMGMTFTRGDIPAFKVIENKDDYFITSPLFAGPFRDLVPRQISRSFDVFNGQLKEKMPLPSMMLGYTGEGGNDMETVLRCIVDGLRARGSGPHPRVLLVKTADEKRSGPREWQYADVKAEMALRGGSVVIYTNQPPAQTNLMGVMTGAKTVTPAAFGTFAPGAFGEHFTSWSAEFQKPQTKCTEWLKAGATVTAGMVTEPHNNPVQFPHARFFVHYAAGCTAMESFYQSIGSPLQILLLGNPLSQIAGTQVEIKAVGLKDVLSSDLDDSAFVAEARFSKPVRILYSALLDGKEIQEADEMMLIELPFSEMADGYHEIRLVAQALALPPVTPGGFRDFPVIVDKKGRSVEITGLADGEPHQVLVTAVPVGEEKPEELFLLWNNREFDRQPVSGEVILTVDERVLGEGPHRIQVVAVYADGMEVRSAPRSFAIEFKAESE